MCDSAERFLADRNLLAGIKVSSRKTETEPRRCPAHYTALPLTEKIETPTWSPWSTKDGVNYAHATREALEQIPALRIHLDDSTSTNGPLRVITRTHCKGVLTDSEIQERKRSHRNHVAGCSSALDTCCDSRIIESSKRLPAPRSAR
jgi:hypothetical protein